MRYEKNLQTGEVTEHEDCPAVYQPEPIIDYEVLRKQAYINESDPVFFKEQRGEVPEGTWVALVAEIKLRYSPPIEEPIVPKEGDGQI